MISPALIMILGGLGMLFIRGIFYRAAIILLPISTIVLLTQFSPTVAGMHFMGISGYDVMVRPFSTLFACGFTLVALLVGIKGMFTEKPKEMAIGYMYAGSAIAITYASNYMFLLFFWELMAILSTLLIWRGGMKDSSGAGMRYAMMHLLGGALFLLGVSAKVAMGDGLALVPMALDSASILGGIHAWGDALIFFAVLVNVAAPPFSAWVADSYAEASPSSAVLLSACTTKAGIFVLLTLFSGNTALIYLGAFMVLYGFIYALLATDIRKILSYLLVQGLGVLVITIGIGTPLAQAGATLQALSHMLYGAVLFMAAGIVIERTGKRDIHAVSGLSKAMPLVAISVAVALLSAIALPGSLPFLAKALITKAAISENIVLVKGLLTLVGVMAVAQFIFPWFVFMRARKTKIALILVPRPVSRESSVSCLLGAAMLLVLGFFPQVVLPLMPATLSFALYEFHAVVKQMALILLALGLFKILLPFLSRTRVAIPDMDILYRVFLLRILSIVETVWSMVVEAFNILIAECVRRIGRSAKHYFGEQGVASKNRSISSVVLAMLLMLSLLVLVYLFR